jgi:hypothetical protein
MNSDNLEDTKKSPESSTNWAPIFGRWSFEDGNAQYLGSETVTPVPQPTATPFGICVSSVQFSEGEISCIVRLPRGDNPGVSSDTSAYVLLGYRSARDEYFGAGLAGWRSAYTIMKNEPVRGWVQIALAGSKENLIPEHLYNVRVRVRGQNVVLHVDDVRVLEHVLDEPLLPNAQLGLFAYGSRPVNFGGVSTSKEEGTVFVIMQFHGPYQDLYTDVIQPTVKKFGLRAYHAGEVFTPGIILNDITGGIAEAKIVIADITPPNQNVFYEVGYAHALRKPTILLVDRERGKDLPFDVSGYRCLFYDNTIGGKRKLEDGLRNHLAAILQSQPA